MLVLQISDVIDCRFAVRHIDLLCLYLPCLSSVRNRQSVACP